MSGLLRHAGKSERGGLACHSAGRAPLPFTASPKARQLRREAASPYIGW